MLARTLADILWRIGTAAPSCEYLRSAKAKTSTEKNEKDNISTGKLINISSSLTSRIANEEFADSSENSPSVSARSSLLENSKWTSSNHVRSVSTNSSTATLVSDSTSQLNATNSSLLDPAPAVVKIVRPTKRPVHVTQSCYRTTFGCGAKDFITENVCIKNEFIL